MKYYVHTFFLFLILFITFCIPSITVADTHFVSTSGANSPPYTSWADAASNIQAAVDVSVDGDLILVKDGTYLLLSSLSITKSLTVRSQNGTAVTIIDGNHSVCCVFMNNAGAILDGFTITHGMNLGGYGGGVQCDNGIIQNCIIENNASRDGGGVALDGSGMVINCIIRNNTADWGGGVRCFNGTVRGCLITENTATPHGGGVNIWSRGIIQNCTITNNTATDGAGIRLWNNGIVENSIISFNTGSSNYIIDEGHGNSLSYSCTTPAYTGTGTANITADPLFVAAGSNDYHLSSSSTLKNAGLNATWMNTAIDLDGHSRILDATVDIGAYEYQSVVIGGPVPIASWPVGNPTEYTNPPTLSWYLGTSGAGLSYEIQCVEASETIWPTNYATSSTMSYTFTSGLTAGVQYTWRVRSVHGAVKSNWSAQAFFTMVANTAGVPVVPIASWPIGNPTLYTNPPTLNWYLGTSGAGLSYEIQCVEASETVWPTNYATSSTMSYTFTSGLTAGVQYTWRVRSVLGTVKSDWSTQAFFTMVAANSPVQPIPGSPTNFVTVNTASPELFWYLPTASSDQEYELSYSTSSDMSDAVLINNINSLQYKLDNLNSGETYYWVVQSKKSDGSTSIASQQGAFKIEKTTDVKESKKIIIPDKFNLFQNYPNPFNPETKIGFSIAEAGRFSIKVFNVLGEEVAVLVNREFLPGTYEINFNAGNLVSGIYFYQLNGSQINIIKKMILTK
ncbi:MAG: T9SS type A sorting domain-containing protein [Ignavibacteriales bacterium]|nr:T9SS type A sorting domain-containing protein [Ignavibacteriales bacterium]